MKTLFVVFLFAVSISGCASAPKIAPLQPGDEQTAVSIIRAHCPSVVLPEQLDFLPISAEEYRRHTGGFVAKGSGKKRYFAVVGPRGPVAVVYLNEDTTMRLGGCRPARTSPPPIMN